MTGLHQIGAYSKVDRDPREEVILSPLLILQSLIGHYLLLGRMMQPKQNGGH